MLLAFIDEANPEPNNQSSAESRFLVIGALLIPASICMELNQEIEIIREENGFRRNDPLKFAVNERPTHVSRDQHARAKSQVINKISELGVQTIIYCALHKIIDNKGQDNYLNWGMDACLTKIQQYCAEEGHTEGFFVFFDRHSRRSISNYLRTKFQDRNHQERIGHRTPDLIGVSQVWDGTSHLASICDIVTGSFNYIVNNPHRDIAGKTLINALKPLVWGERTSDGRLDVMERGLLFRPTTQSPRYKTYYDETKERIVNWANEVDQN